MSSSARPALGVAAAAAAALLFGINGTVSKLALEAGLTLDAPRRAALARARRSASMAAVLRHAPRLAARSIAASWRSSWWPGIVGIGLVQWLYFVAIARLPVGIALLLEYLAPVFVALWVLLRPPRARPAADLGGAGALPGRARRRRRGVGGAHPRRHRASWPAWRAGVSLAAYYLTGEHGLGRRDPLSLAAWTFAAAAVFWSVLQPPWAFAWSSLGDAVALPGPFDGAEVPLGGAGGVDHRARHGGALRPRARRDPQPRLHPHRPARDGRAGHVRAWWPGWCWASRSRRCSSSAPAVVILGIVAAETARTPAPRRPSRRSPSGRRADGYAGAPDGEPGPRRRRRGSDRRAGLALLGVEQLVEQLDRDRALAHRGGDAAHPAVAQVAGGEHPGHARLEEERAALQRPGALGDVGTGHHEPLRVALDRRPAASRSWAGRRA